MNKFHHFKEIAKALPDEDIREYATESLKGFHKCQECFACACVEILQERKKNKKKQ